MSTLQVISGQEAEIEQLKKKVRELDAKNRELGVTTEMLFLACKMADEAIAASAKLFVSDEEYSRWSLVQTALVRAMMHANDAIKEES